MGADQTFAVLADIDRRHDHTTATRAITDLATNPTLLMQFDQHVRTTKGIKKTQTPAGLVIAASAANGHMREQAVRQMIGNPIYIPYLVIRTADWVPEVRDVARGAMAVLLHDDPATTLTAVVPVLAQIRDWYRADFLLAQLRTVKNPRFLWDHGPESLRRIAFDLAERQLTVEELVEVAETDGNRYLRGRAAELVAREVLWNTRTRHLTRLAKSRHPEVRAAAVTGLVRAVHDVVGYLNDPSPLVRAMARDAARRVGVDPRVHYLATLPDAGAIDGLSEVGGGADALEALLTHESGKVRARALRALRRLDTYPPDLLPLLTDPATSVIREATIALRKSGRTLPEDHLWTLLDDTRPAVRRAAYRLLKELPSGRAAATRLQHDHDPRLARMVAMDLHSKPTRDA